MAFRESDETKRRREQAEAMQYSEGADVAAARSRRDALEKNTYENAYNERMSGLINDFANRKPFAYDVNADALYKQYANKYMTAGRQAMADTIGKASSMTGGYGNSYAASAGAQAYNAHVQQLGDAIPELYNMAYSRYQDEGRQMQDLYNMYGSQDSLEYGKYRDALSDYYTALQWDRSTFDAERENALNRADAAYNRELAAYQQGVSEDQFDRNLALQYAQLGENARQYDKSYWQTNEQWQDRINTGYGGGTQYVKQTGASDPSADTSAASGSTEAKSESVASLLWGNGGSKTSSGSGNKTVTKSGSGGKTNEFFSSVMTQNEWSKHGAPGGSYKAYLNGVASAKLKEGSISPDDADAINAEINKRYK